MRNEKTLAEFFCTAGLWPAFLNLFACEAQGNGNCAGRDALRSSGQAGGTKGEKNDIAICAKNRRSSCGVTVAQAEAYATERRLLS
jgi:hypothetical protein